MIPTNQQLRYVHADPNLAEAAAVVKELRKNGLNFSEMGRLADIPSQVEVLKRLDAGTCKRVSPETTKALIAGYAKYLDGFRGYAKPKGSRPRGETSTPAAESERQPLTHLAGSRLWDRLAQRVKEAA